MFQVVLITWCLFTFYHHFSFNWLAIKWAGQHDWQIWSHHRCISIKLHVSWWIIRNCLLQWTLLGGGRFEAGTLSICFSPVRHLDNHHLWDPNEFAVSCFRIIMYSIQVKHRPAVSTASEVLQRRDLSVSSSSLNEGTGCAVSSALLSIGCRLAHVSHHDTSSVSPRHKSCGVPEASGSRFTVWVILLQSTLMIGFWFSRGPSSGWFFPNSAFLVICPAACRRLPCDDGSTASALTLKISQNVSSCYVMITSCVVGWTAGDGITWIPVTATWWKIWVDEFCSTKVTHISRFLSRIRFLFLLLYIVAPFCLFMPPFIFT